MGATPVRSPGWPPRPNELLKYEPSTVMLFSRLSCPAKFEPLACGVRRVMSPIRPEMVGSVASSSLVTAVAAPVRFELNTGSLTPTTTMSSAMAATFSVKSRSCATPRLRETFSFTSVLNPLTDALTRYGPPTRIPGMKNRPSPCVMVSYLVPEGSWMAVTAAPGITAPCASLTRPVIEAVVTPCAWLCRDKGARRCSTDGSSQYPPLTLDVLPGRYMGSAPTRSTNRRPLRDPRRGGPNVSALWPCRASGRSEERPLQATGAHPKTNTEPRSAPDEG